MKKKALIGKIIGVILICIFSAGITYVVMHYVERAKYQNINLLVTFEDTKEFTLENTKKLDKENALLTYPYIFTMENKGKNTTSFKINLQDKLSDNLERENLDYIIICNDKEIKSGNLKDINSDTNLFYEGKITGKSKDTYKVYIYLNEDIKDVTYTYSLLVDAK